MRRVIALAVAGASLAGCSSFSMDMFKSVPPPIQVRLESTPPGADAKTSLGPGCRTPCSVSVPTPEGGNFTVSYLLDKFQPATVPVQVTKIPGDFSTPASTTIDPNPVTVELQPAAPVKPVRHKPRRPRIPKPAAAAPDAAPAAPAAGGSPFPAPPR